MKRNRLFPAICLAAALLLSACSQDEPTENSTALPEGEYPLQIGSVTLSAEVSEQPWTRMAESTDGMSSEFKAGDAIGVSLYGKTATYTYDGNTWTSEAPLYWKDKNYATVTAWYPVEEEIDFTQQDVKGLTYLLKGTSNTDADYDTPANLTFAHQLAKVRVVLEGTKATEVQQVYVRSYPKSVNNQGDLGETTGGDPIYVPMMEATYNGQRCWEANLRKGYLDENNSFQVANADGVRVQVTQGRVNIEAGHVHTIKVNVGEAQPVEGEISDDDYYLVSEARNEPVTITGGSPTVYLKGASIDVSDGPAISITGGTPTIHVIGEGNSVSSSNNTGIAVSNGATVTITGNSTADALTAKGGTSDGYDMNVTVGAGIGSPVGGTKGGNIIIRNVTVNATGGKAIYNYVAGGAGIGSSSNGICGDITIANAVISATGGDYAAGIGMGCNYLNSESPAAGIGKISITDSDITAIGGIYAAAIGFPISQTIAGKGTYRAGQISITTGNEDVFLSKLQPGGTDGDTTITPPQRIGKGSYNYTPTFLNTDGTDPWEGVVINGTAYPDGVE